MLLTQVPFQLGTHGDDGGTSSKTEGTLSDPNNTMRDQNRAESPRNGLDVGVDDPRDEV
jgi:hypothetical protein